MRIVWQTPADFPLLTSRGLMAASRFQASARSNEPPRQIEDDAHKMLRAAATCAEPRPRAHALSLRARRRHLKPARPQRCQSLERAACSTLGWPLNWTEVPHALSCHPMLVLQQR